MSPLPAPNSTTLNFLGDFKFFQNKIIHTVKTSEKIIDIDGLVIKSPLAPKGFFLYNIHSLDHTLLDQCMSLEVVNYNFFSFALTR